ncbi:hypothetical protein CE169_11855, partial [Bifidobacterium longum]
MGRAHRHDRPERLHAQNRHHPGQRRRNRRPVRLRDPGHGGNIRHPPRPRTGGHEPAATHQHTHYVHGRPPHRRD